LSAYIDSAIIAKLYCEEPNSSEAVRLVSRFTPPLWFSPLQDIEIRNAWRLKQFRGELDESSADRAISRLDSDIASGLYRRSAVDFETVAGKAEQLSASHSRQIGCRSLDILHVAYALSVGVENFASYDKRQRDLARKAGLQIHPRRS